MDPHAHELDHKYQWAQKVLLEEVGEKKAAPWQVESSMMNKVWELVMLNLASTLKFLNILVPPYLMKANTYKYMLKLYMPAKLIPH